MIEICVSAGLILGYTLNPKNFKIWPLSWSKNQILSITAILKKRKGARVLFVHHPYIIVCIIAAKVQTVFWWPYIGFPPERFNIGFPTNAKVNTRILISDVRSDIQLHFQIILFVFVFRNNIALRKIMLNVMITSIIYVYVQREQTRELQYL